MPGSEIHFREPTVWEQYRAQILTVCAVILLQSALISWLLYPRLLNLPREVRNIESTKPQGYQITILVSFLSLAARATAPKKPSGPDLKAAIPSLRIIRRGVTAMTATACKRSG
jgi:hypothetical protein